METSAQGAGLVYLSKPNNPTATVLSARAITGLIDRVARVSPQTAVLVDGGITNTWTTRRTLNRAVRESTRQLFESLGFSVGPSETNFVLVDLGRDSRTFRDACQRTGVAVGRPFPPLNNYARISIGTMEEMQRAGAIFKRVLGSAGTAPGR